MKNENENENEIEIQQTNKKPNSKQHLYNQFDEEPKRFVVTKHANASNNDKEKKEGGGGKGLD